MTKLSGGCKITKFSFIPAIYSLDGGGLSQYQPNQEIIYKHAIYDIYTGERISLAGKSEGECRDKAGEMGVSTRLGIKAAFFHSASNGLNFINPLDGHVAIAFEDQLPILNRKRFKGLSCILDNPQFSEIMEVAEAAYDGLYRKNPEGDFKLAKGPGHPLPVAINSTLYLGNKVIMGPCARGLDARAVFASAGLEFDETIETNPSPYQMEYTPLFAFLAGLLHDAAEDNKAVYAAAVKRGLVPSLVNSLVVGMTRKSGNGLSKEEKYQQNYEHGLITALRSSLTHYGKALFMLRMQDLMHNNMCDVLCINPVGDPTKEEATRKGFEEGLNMLSKHGCQVRFSNPWAVTAGRIFPEAQSAQILLPQTV